MEYQKYTELASKIDELMGEGNILFTREYICFASEQQLPGELVNEIEIRVTISCARTTEIIKGLINEVAATSPRFRHSAGGRLGRGMSSSEELLYSNRHERLYQRLLAEYNAIHTWDYKKELSGLEGEARQAKALHMLQYNYPVEFANFTIEEAQGSDYFSRLENIRSKIQEGMWESYREDYYRKLHAPQLIEISSAYVLLRKHIEQAASILLPQLLRELNFQALNTQQPERHRAIIDYCLSEITDSIQKVEHNQKIAFMVGISNYPCKFLPNAELIRLQDMEIKANDVHAKIQLHNKRASYFFYVELLQLLYTIKGKLGKVTIKSEPVTQATGAAERLINEINAAPVVQTTVLPFPPNSPKLINIDASLIEPLYDCLKGHFQLTDHAELFDLLNGKPVKRKLLFNNLQNKFCELFKRIKYCNFLPDSATHIAGWITDNFQRIDADHAVCDFNKESVYKGLTKSSADISNKKDRICEIEQLQHLTSTQQDRLKRQK